MNELILMSPRRGEPVLLDAYGSPLALVNDEARDMSLKEFTELWKLGVDINNGKGGGSYRKHPTVYRAINTTANAIASLPAHVKKESDDDVVYDQPINALFDRPAPRKSFYDLIFATVCQLEWSGNACIWMDFGMQGRVKPGQLPDNLVVLNSRALRPIVRNDVELTGYEYKLKNGHRVIFTPEEIMHLMYYDPENPWWGQSTMEAACDSIYLDMLVHRFGTAFFNNSGQMGGILIHKGSQDVSSKLPGIRKEFEDKHVGVDRAHRPAILAGNWEYHETGLSLQEMALLGLREFLREDIGAVFNVPNIYLNREKGVSVATATVEARIFAETNWLPKARMIESAFKSQFFRKHAPGLYMRFDVSEAPGIREDLVDKIATFVQLADRGVWIGDIIRLLNIDLPIRPDYNAHFMPMGMIPADMLLDGSGGLDADNDGDEADDDGNDSEDDGDNTDNEDANDKDNEDDAQPDKGDGKGKTKKKALRRLDGLPGLRRLTQPMSLAEREKLSAETRSEVLKIIEQRAPKKKQDAKGKKKKPQSYDLTKPVQSCAACGGGECRGGEDLYDEPERFGLIDDEDRDFFWRAFVGALDPVEKKFATMLRDHFFALRREVLENLHKLDKEPETKGVRTRASQADIKRILFDLAEAKKRLGRRATPLYRSAMKLGGDMMLAELSIDDTFDVNSSRSIDFINKRKNFLANVNRTVWNHVRDQLHAGIEAGESIGELADRLRGNVFNPAASRARTIARTETMTVVNTARYDVMNDEGVVKIEWLSARDKFVRQPPDSKWNHLIDGQRRKTGELFSTRLRFPHDDQSPGSEAGNLINCRCTTIPVVD